MRIGFGRNCGGGTKADIRIAVNIVAELRRTRADTQKTEGVNKGDQELNDSCQMHVCFQTLL